MAELPQIQAQPQQFQSRELVVPPNRVPEAIRNTTLIAERQITDISEILQRQKQVIDDRKAINELFDAESNVRDSASTIKDYDTATSSYIGSMQGFRSDILQKYPNLSEIGQAELSRITDKKIQSFRTHMLIKQNQQQQSDIAAVIPDTIKRINESQTVEDRNAATYDGLTFIDDMYRHGAIDDARRETLKHTLIGAKQQSEWDEITLQHPEQAGSISPEEAGVPLPKYYEGLYKANGVREHKMKTNSLAHEEMINKYETAVSNGEYADNPTALVQLKDAGMISPRIFQMGIAFTPPHLRAKENLENILHETPWNSKEDVQEFYRNYVRSNDIMSAADRSYLHGEVQTILDHLGDPQARTARELYFALKDYGSIHGVGLIDNPRYRGPEKEQYENLLGMARDRLFTTKDSDTMFKAYMDTVNALEKLFKVGEKPMLKPGDNVHGVFNRSFLNDPEIK